MGSKFLRTLLPSIGLAYGLQAAVGLPSSIAQTERFYDLSGSLTYLSCTALSLYLPAYRLRAAAIAAGTSTTLSRFPSVVEALATRNWRSIALSAGVGLWAVRLGSFLFSRITSENGQDSRFDKIRSSPAKFAVAWFAQATWVSLVLMPVLAVNSLPIATFAALPTLMVTDVLGLALWIGGFTFEVTADRQKSQWMEEKKEKKHSEEFLTRGLWSKSRHPNYFGEMTLWTGIATLAAGVLATRTGLATAGLPAGLAGQTAAVAMAGVSPAFTTFLLTKVSGIPLSENKYDKRYGDRADYKKWKQNTPMLFPKLF